MADMDELAPITGIVLAAGRSSRMGRSKALLPCGPGRETFVARVVRTLQEGGVSNTLVVGRPLDTRLRAEVEHLAGAVTRYVENPAPDRGQLSSLIVGMDHASRRGAQAIIVMPVDMPQVRPASVAAIVAAFAEVRHSQALIFRAAYEGRHGHPVIFHRSIFDELRVADPELGAKAVLLAYADRILNVEVDDPGVVRDVDSPADYTALFGRPPDAAT